MLGSLPENYHLTYSWNESSRHNTAGAILSRGRNVATVFDVDYYPSVGRIGALPDEWTINGRSRQVIDGDSHDFRIPEEDGRGVIVGLRLKGTNAAKERARKSGFALAVN